MAGAEEEAVRELTEAARAFAGQKLLRNVTALYARALRRLVDSARAFARKTDEAWAAELIEERGRTKKAAALLLASAAEGPDGQLCWCGDGEINAYCWHEPSPSAFCRERSELLAEVDPD